jgi:hypothetical protein
MVSLEMMCLMKTRRMRKQATQSWLLRFDAHLVVADADID